MTERAKYPARERVRRKYTEELDTRLQEIVEAEHKKDLRLGEGVKVYHMAVLSSPGGGFRWAYPYTNEKQGVFLDSHVKFFEMMGGCHKEVVYDNMKNVVKKFIGRNEKELNPELVKMAAYYGFRINVTNCFSGNEKGHVESSVKILRNQVCCTGGKPAVFHERYI